MKLNYSLTQLVWNQGYGLNLSASKSNICDLSVIDLPLYSSNFLIQTYPYNPSSHPFNQRIHLNFSIDLSCERSFLQHNQLKSDVYFSSRQTLSDHFGHSDYHGNLIPSIRGPCAFSILPPHLHRTYPDGTGDPGFLFHSASHSDKSLQETLDSLVESRRSCLSWWSLLLPPVFLGSDYSLSALIDRNPSDIDSDIKADKE